jgi:hypothetical protein
MPRCDLCREPYSGRRVIERPVLKDPHKSAAVESRSHQQSRRSLDRLLLVAKRSWRDGALLIFLMRGREFPFRRSACGKCGWFREADRPDRTQRSRFGIVDTPSWRRENPMPWV